MGLPFSAGSEKWAARWWKEKGVGDWKGEGGTDGEWTVGKGERGVEELVPNGEVQ